MARHLSSLVIDNLCDEPCEEDLSIAMFYCDFHDWQKQTATSLGGAVLKRLLARGEVLEDMQKAFRKAKWRSAVEVCDFRMWCGCRSKLLSHCLRVLFILML